MTLNRAVSIFDDDRTSVCQIRFITLSCRAPLLTRSMSRFLVLIFIWELNWIVISAGRRDINCCGTCLVREHRMSVTSVPHISIEWYHDLWTRNSVQLATAVHKAEWVLLTSSCYRNLPSWKDPILILLMCICLASESLIKLELLHVFFVF